MRVPVRFATLSPGMVCVAACALREPNPSKKPQGLSDAVDYRPGDLTSLNTTLHQQRSASANSDFRVIEDELCRLLRSNAPALDANEVCQNYVAP